MRKKSPIASLGGGGESAQEKREVIQELGRVERYRRGQGLEGEEVTKGGGSLGKSAEKFKKGKAGGCNRKQKLRDVQERKG